VQLGLLPYQISFKEDIGGVGVHLMLKIPPNHLLPTVDFKQLPVTNILRVAVKLKPGVITSLPEVPLELGVVWMPLETNSQCQHHALQLFLTTPKLYRVHWEVPGTT